MIKTQEQASKVQQRRADSGKRGYAKAVRRYLLRTSHADTYRVYKARLPVYWGG